MRSEPRPDTDTGYLAHRLLDAVEDAPAIDVATLKKALRKLRQALKEKSS